MGIIRYFLNSIDNLNQRRFESEIKYRQQSSLNNYLGKKIEITQKISHTPNQKEIQSNATQCFELTKQASKKCDTDAMLELCATFYREQGKYQSLMEKYNWDKENLSSADLAIIKKLEINNSRELYPHWLELFAYYSQKTQASNQVRNINDIYYNPRSLYLRKNQLKTYEFIAFQALIKEKVISNKDINWNNIPPHGVPKIVRKKYQDLRKILETKKKYGAYNAYIILIIELTILKSAKKEDVITNTKKCLKNIVDNPNSSGINIQTLDHLVTYLGPIDGRYFDYLFDQTWEEVKQKA